MTDINRQQRPRKMAREIESAPIPLIKSSRQPPAAEPAPLPNKPPTKIEQVLIQLRSSEGASLERLAKTTGWLPHTTRAALTGLRRKGHPLMSERIDGVRRYRIIAHSDAGQGF